MMMEQKLAEAKKMLNKKRRLAIGGLIISIFYIFDPFHLTDGHDKVCFVFWLLAIISAINAVTYFKEKPQDWIWDEEENV